MDELERFEQLARKANADQPPPIDVTGQVLQRVGSEERVEMVTQRTLIVCGAVSALAATLIVAVTAWAWVSWNDPLQQMFTQTLTIVL